MLGNTWICYCRTLKNSISLPSNCIKPQEEVHYFSFLLKTSKIVTKPSVDPSTWCSKNLELRSITSAHKGSSHVPIYHFTNISLKMLKRELYHEILRRIKDDEGCLLESVLQNFWKFISYHERGILEVQVRGSWSWGMLYQLLGKQPDFASTSLVTPLPHWDASSSCVAREKTPTRRDLLTTGIESDEGSKVTEQSTQQNS